MTLFLEDSFSLHSIDKQHIDSKRLDVYRRNFNWYVATFPQEKVKVIEGFIKGLETYSGTNVFNPWRDVDFTLDCAAVAAEIRQNNLMAYLLPRLGRASIFIVAEAMGYQGGRFTGIAITCERMLLGLHKTIEARDVTEIDLMRTSSITSELLKRTQREQGFNEPTDTVVWNVIVEAGLNPYDTLLWNIFPFHPHKRNESLTNRTPTQEEQSIGFSYTEQLLAIHKQCGGAEPLVVAVGQKSANTLGSFGLQAIGLRHPANGGANLYRQGFKDALRLYDVIG